MTHFDDEQGKYVEEPAAEDFPEVKSEHLQTTIENGEVRRTFSNVPEEKHGFFERRRDKSASNKLHKEYAEKERLDSQLAKLNREYGKTDNNTRRKQAIENRKQQISRLKEQHKSHSPAMHGFNSANRLVRKGKPKRKRRASPKRKSRAAIRREILRLERQKKSLLAQLNKM